MSVKSSRLSGIIILDNASEETIFKEKGLFKDLETGEPIFVDGIDINGEGIYMDKVGNTSFGKAYYSPMIAGNILSYANCVDKCHSVTYVQKNDIVNGKLMGRK